MRDETIVDAQYEIPEPLDRLGAICGKEAGRCSR
jgi:hypothetical protein